MGRAETVAVVDVPTKRSQQRRLPVGSLPSVALSGTPSLAPTANLALLKTV